MKHKIARLIGYRLAQLVYALAIIGMVASLYIILYKLIMTI